MTEESKKKGKLILDTSRIYYCSGPKIALIVGTRTEKLPPGLDIIKCPFDIVFNCTDKQRKCRYLPFKSDEAFPRVNVVFDIKPEVTVSDLYQILNNKFKGRFSKEGEKFVDFLEKIVKKELFSAIFSDVLVEGKFKYLSGPSWIIFPRVPVKYGKKQTFVMEIPKIFPKNKRKIGVHPKELSISYLSDTLIFLINKEKVRKAAKEFIDETLRIEGMAQIREYEDRMAAYSLFAREYALMNRRSSDERTTRMFWKSSFLGSIYRNNDPLLKDAQSNFLEKIEKNKAIYNKILGDCVNIFYYTLAHILALEIIWITGGMENYILYVPVIERKWDEIHIFEAIDGGSAGLLRTAVNFWEKEGSFEEEFKGKEDPGPFRYFKANRAVLNLMEKWREFLEEHDEFNKEREEKLKSTINNTSDSGEGIEDVSKILNEIIEKLKRFSPQESEFFKIFGYEFLITMILDWFYKKVESLDSETREKIWKVTKRNPLRELILEKLLKENMGNLCGDGCEGCLYLSNPAEGPLMQEFLVSKWIFRAISRRLIRSSSGSDEKQS